VQVRAPYFDGKQASHILGGEFQKPEMIPAGREMAAVTGPISVVLAKRTKLECELVCRALKAYKRQIDVAAWALTLEDLLKKVAEHRPEVAVISSTLEGDPQGGLKALQKLRESGATTRPIMLVDCSSPEMVTDAFTAGAKGIVCREEPLEVLCKCIQRVHAGQVWVNTQEVQWLLESLATREPVHVVKAPGTPQLTKREDQIVQLAAEGLPNAEIGTTLGISPHTVKNHLFRIYEKLGVSNRTELILYALSSRQRKDSN
jgi:DNA-binding NarL/FixJ family response regulator